MNKISISSSKRLWLTNIDDYITSLIKCTYFRRKERLLRKNSRNKEIVYELKDHYPSSVLADCSIVSKSITNVNRFDEKKSCSDLSSFV